MQQDNNLPSYQTAMAASRISCTSLKCIKGICTIIMGLCILQMSVAALGFMLLCKVGIYVESFRQYGNSFWIAGPVS